MTRICEHVKIRFPPFSKGGNMHFNSTEIQDCTEWCLAEANTSYCCAQT